MEFLLNPKIENDKLLLLLSTILGALAGCILGLGPFVVIGAIVGLITGLVLRKNYGNDIANNRMQSGAAKLRH